MSSSPDVFSNRHATVAVTVETAALDDGFTGPVRFRIASSSGYLASLPACGIRHGEEDERVPCEKPYGHPVPGKVKDQDEHNRAHCHGWHIESARRFAGDVLATYGAKKPKPRALLKIKYCDAFVSLRKSVAA